MTRPDSQSPDIDELTLVRKFLAGDNSAFDALARRFASRVFATAHRFFSERQTVEDVAQETFTKAFQSLHTFSQQRPFVSWLTAIALNECYRELAKRQRRHERPESTFLQGDCALLDSICVLPKRTAHADPERRALLRDLADRVLQQLSARERMVLVLTEVEGWSIKETAKQMGISPVYARVTAYRARKKARQALSRSHFPKDGGGGL